VRAGNYHAGLLTCVVLRGLAQMARALDYMYKPPVNLVHWDRCQGNIFVSHPNGSTDTGPDVSMGDFIERVAESARTKDLYHRPDMAME